MSDIRMPELAPGMEQGTLARWMVAEGARVQAGDAIAEIETDKATVELEAPESGVLQAILVAEGTANVAVGTPIARLAASDEAGASSGSNAAAGSPSGAPTTAAATAEPAPAREYAAAPAPTEVPGASAAPPSPAPARTNGNGAGKAGPFVRRLARQLDIDLDAVRGSGPGGRILKADLDAVSPALDRRAPRPEAPAPSPVVDVPPPPDVPHEVIALSNMRATIARRLTESKRSIPHFYQTIDVLADRLLEARAALNARDPELRLSLNDFVIKALGVALTRVPAANVQFGGSRLYRFQRVDLSVAVAIPEGLITPVIRDVGAKGLRQIAAEMRDLADRARRGRLGPAEYQGGTFSLSNMGMYRIKQFAAVINPPQAGILAVGAAEERVVPRDGAVAIARVMSLTLACDHRAIDGAIGAAVLNEVQACLEDPMSMLL